MLYSANTYAREDINASTKTDMPPRRTGCLTNFAKVGQTSGNRSRLKAINARRKHCESIIDNLLGAPTSPSYAEKAFRFPSHHSVRQRSRYIDLARSIRFQAFLKGLYQSRTPQRNSCLGFLAPCQGNAFLMPVPRRGVKRDTCWNQNPTWPRYRQLIYPNAFP